MLNIEKIAKLLLLKMNQMEKLLKLQQNHFSEYIYSILK